MPVLAAALVDRLDCAVLGMRFPVVDDFAIALNRELYGLLIGQGQPLAAAVGIALPDLVAGPATPACPALSAGTPALFGARAVDLVLAGTGAGRRWCSMRSGPSWPASPPSRTGLWAGSG